MRVAIPDDRQETMKEIVKITKYIKRNSYELQRSTKGVNTVIYVLRTIQDLVLDISVTLPQKSAILESSHYLEKKCYVTKIIDQIMSSEQYQ